MTEMPFQFPGQEVAGNNTPRFTVNHYQFLHFMAGIDRYISLCYLPFEGLIGAKK